MPSVLVLDADQSSALAIVRSLGRKGLEVHVASADAAPLCARSRHAAAVHRYPDPLTREADFVEWLEQATRAQRFELVIPVTERTVVPLMKARQRFAPSLLALAPDEALKCAIDKDRTIALAESLGISVPVSRVVRALHELDDARAGLEFPIVVKPLRSFGTDAARRVQLAVSYAFNAEELRSQAAAALRYGEVILQEYFVGQGVGVELLAADGEVVQAFQHRRLHEVPLTGGGSSLRISEAPAPQLLEAAARLMKALRWHGVAMVEFKHRPADGAYRLMEINGRFWGSLPLAVAAGADFPATLHELMTTGRVAPRKPARAGVVCRHLARDLDWLEHVVRRAAPPGLAQLPSAGQVLRDWLLVLSPRHRFDVQSLSDPWPGMVDLGHIVQRMGRRIMGVAVARWQLHRARAAARRAASSRLPQARRVLFVCYGNINRSALAHAYARQRFAGRCEFESAGFHPHEGRPADPTMVEVAGAQGVDLRDWASVRLSSQAVDRADLILAMEQAHLERLVAEHPQARDKAFLLGGLGHDHPEVPDPYGRSRNDYARVARQVVKACDAWFGRGTEAA